MLNFKSLHSFFFFLTTMTLLLLDFRFSSHNIYLENKQMTQLYSIKISGNTDLGDETLYSDQISPIKINSSLFRSIIFIGRIKRYQHCSSKCLIPPIFLNRILRYGGLFYASFPRCEYYTSMANNKWKVTLMKI